MMLQRKEDEVIDRLLRVEVRREAALGGVCADFDPDLAAAYLERRLNNGERGSYETHLIQCHTCRTGIVRLAQLDGSPACAPYTGATMTERVAKVSIRSGRPRRLAGLGASIFTPQWVAAAAAILIAVISIPLVFIRIAGRKSGPAAYRAQVGSTAKESTPILGTGGASGSGGQDQAGSEASGGAVTPKKDSIGEQTDSDGAIAKDAERAQGNDKADGNAGKPDADGNLLALAKGPASVAGKTEADEGPRSSDRTGAAEASRQPTGAPVPAPPSAQQRRGDAPSDQSRPSMSVSGSRASAGPSGALSAGASSSKEADHKDAGLPRLDPDKALRLTEDGGKTEVSVLKRGRASDQPQPTKEKAAAIKPQDSVAPPPESTTEEGMTHGRRAIAEPPGKEFVSESKPAEETHWNRNAATGPVKLAKGERRVEGKRFRLINGVWTDRGFKPDKEMASVTLVRDSDVYKALLAKEDTLRGYLSGFGASERAIIVYKKIVYKLMPATTSGTED
jgi:hypothetical protein